MLYIECRSKLADWRLRLKLRPTAHWGSASQRLLGLPTFPSHLSRPLESRLAQSTKQVLLVSASLLINHDSLSAKPDVVSIWGYACR